MADIPWIPNKFEEEEKMDVELNEKCRKALKQYSVSALSTEYGCICDRIWINETGGTVAVEMKHRFGRKFSDVFIEPKKYENLMDLYRIKNILPFYINHWNEDEFFYLWVLPAVNEENIKLHRNVPIKDAIVGKKWEDRYGLNFNDAYCFRFNGELIRKPKNKQLKTKAPDAHDIQGPITNNLLKNIEK